MNQVEWKKLQRKCRKSSGKVKSSLKSWFCRLENGLKSKQEKLSGLDARAHFQRIKESGDAYLDQVMVTVTGVSKRLTK